MVENPQQNPKNDNKLPNKDKLLELDSKLDSGIYTIKYYITYFWDFVNVSMDKFTPDGASKLVLEIVSDFLTYFLIGVTLLSLFGSAILQITHSDWQAKDKISVTFLDRYNQPLGERGQMSGQSVPISEMPPYVIKAVLATEDRRFYNHIGVDFFGLIRALTQNMQRGGVVQGGSTITQQLAKNLFLNNNRNIVRKIKEAVLALWLEANYTKQQILQMYLDSSYMGGGNFGINSAAHFYFGKDIRDVSLSEAAILGGLFKAPTKYAPHIHPEAAAERANVVLDNLVRSGFMNESEVEDARKHPAVTVASAHSKSPDYFLDYAYEQIRHLDLKVDEHHLIVQTTLDPRIQEAAENAIEHYIKTFGSYYHVKQGAAVVLAKNGGLRAMVGGVDYDTSRFNRAVHGLRQVGSSFKPYVYAIALEHGLTPYSIVLDEPINWGGWTPHNDNNRYLGRVTLTTALAYSINTVAVRLAYEYLNRDINPIYNLVKNMGIAGSIVKHKTMVLGTSSMTTLDQATGYNVFSNGGLTGNRHIFLKISTPSGKVVWSYNPSPMRRVLSAQSTAYLNQMLTQVVQHGSGGRASIDGIPIAGKTGTTQNYRDAWFCGFSGNFTTAVWMGNDNYTPTNRLFGGILPALAFHQIMLAAHKTVQLAPLYGVNTNYRKQHLEHEDSNNYSAMGILSPSSTDIIKQIQHELANDQ